MREPVSVHQGVGKERESVYAKVYVRRERLTYEVRREREGVGQVETVVVVERGRWASSTPWCTLTGS